MRGWRSAEAKRRASLLIGDRLTEEAEQTIANTRERIEAARRSLLARVMGNESMEDVLKWGGPPPEQP